MIGTVGDQDLPVLMRAEALEQARRAAHVGAQAEEEIGGFLLGKVHRDPADDRLFVDVSEVVEADKAQGTYVSLHFNYDSWQPVLDRIDREHGDKGLIGWFHTHLISSVDIWSEVEQENVFRARYRPFFSQPDHFIHQNFFPHPWNVALVLDLRCKQEVYFTWRDGFITGPRGFHLYDDNTETVETASADKV